MLTIGCANTSGLSPSTSHTSPMVRDGRRASLRMLTRMNTLSNGAMPQQNGTPSTQVCCVCGLVYILMLLPGDGGNTPFNNVDVVGATHCRRQLSAHRTVAVDLLRSVQRLARMCVGRTRQCAPARTLRAYARCIAGKRSRACQHTCARTEWGACAHVRAVCSVRARLIAPAHCPC